jgi:hypothetical protein
LLGKNGPIEGIDEGFEVIDGFLWTVNSEIGDANTIDGAFIGEGNVKGDTDMFTILSLAMNSESVGVDAIDMT